MHPWKRASVKARGSTPTESSPQVEKAKKARKIPCRKKAVNVGAPEEPIVNASPQPKRKPASIKDRGSTLTENSPKNGTAKKARNIPRRKKDANAGVADEPIMVSSTSSPTSKVARRPRTRNLSKFLKARGGVKDEEPRMEHGYGRENTCSEDDDGHSVEEKPKKLNVRCNPD
ncbi:hypothetical protein ACP4OV_020560 [Aristida adscensionis]